MLNEIIFLVIESLDGGYEAKAVGYSIYTQCGEYSELSFRSIAKVICNFNKLVVRNTA